MSHLRFSGTLLCFAAFAFPVGAADPFHFPEGTHGKGELRYVNGVPVLTVEGTPEEIGEQIGTLAVKPAADMVSLAKAFLRSKGLEKAWPFLAKAANNMLPQFPADYRKELAGMAKGSGLDPDLFAVCNVIPDMMKLGGCATLIVAPERSATGGPLFGRNFDIDPLGKLHEYSLVIIYRQPDKHAFVSVLFPGFVGCSSGMNDAGLAITANEVFSSNDGAPQFDVKGTPMGVCLRLVLEQCTTLGEAEHLLRSLKCTTMMSFTVCDKTGGAVFELTPRSLVVRPSFEGICCCTNHFCTKELTTGCVCDRLPKLEKSRLLTTLSVEDVHKKLHEVNQGPLTLQTMVFEPTTLKMHVALGKGPTTALDLKLLNLGELFARKAAKP